jgi:GntR family transcriptional regulator
MARQGVTNSIHNLVFEQVTAPDDAQKLRLSAKKTEVYFQKKLLLIDQVPVAVDATFILPDLGKAAEDLKRRMTFPILEQNNLLIEEIEATIASTQADYETSQYLNIPLGSPLLVYSYTAYTTNNKPVVCGEALSRAIAFAIL